MRVRVLRVYHAGRSPAHRARDRALVNAGVDLTLVVPAQWTEGDSQARLTPEPFQILELPVARPGDVNRHRYRDGNALAAALRSVNPDIVDVHEEPLSAAAHQVLSVLPA